MKIMPLGDVFLIKMKHFNQKSVLHIVGDGSPVLEPGVGESVPALHPSGMTASGGQKKVEKLLIWCLTNC